MLLIRNAYIKPITGPDIPNGCLLAEDGRITAVAAHIDAPEGCTVIDAGGRLLTPGCVEAHCHIGLDNQCMRWEGMDYNEIVDPLTPQLRAIDSINPQDEAFPNAIRGGVTTACTGPGSANVVGGTFTVLKLAGKRVDNMLLKEPAAMKCAFGENPKGCYGQGLKKSPMTRMAVAALLRELLFKTQRYRDDKLAGKNPPFDMKLEAMLPVVNGEIPLKCHAHRADDILTAVRIAKEFGVKATLDHCTDGELIADELAKMCENRSYGALLNFGGNVYVTGAKPDGSLYRVVVLEPQNTASSLAVVSLGPGTVGTSGVYERCFERDGVFYHHILDPKTGFPVETDAAGATVVARHSIDAEGYSTTLLALGIERGIAFARERDAILGAYFVDRDGKVAGIA